MATAGRVSWIVFFMRMVPPSCGVGVGSRVVEGCQETTPAKLVNSFLPRGACVVALMKSIVQTGLITTTKCPCPHFAYSYLLSFNF